jgi:hypothetical protein
LLDISTSIMPATGIPSTKTRTAGERTLLLPNATSCRNIHIRQGKRNHSAQPGISYTVELRYPDPLCRILQVLRGNLEQIASCDGYDLHQVPAPLRLLIDLST